MGYFRSGLSAALVASAMTASSSQALAVSYASNITKTGTTVNFILNSPADVLTYSINGGASVTLDGSTKGAKTFNLTNANDTFSIVAERNDAVGFTIPITGTLGDPGAGWTNGLSQQTQLAGQNLLSQDTNVLGRFNSPRGLDVNRNPNTANFGTVYITNSAAGPTALVEDRPARTLAGEGVYALRADQTDAFGYGDAGQNPTASDGFPSFSTASANSPFRVHVSEAGEVFVSDYSDVNGNVFGMNANLTTSQVMLAGVGGPGWDNQTPGNPPPNPDYTALPAGQNHGSISNVYVEGSLAAGNLVMYGVDEDINSAHFGGAETEDRNSLWKWEIGATPGSTGSTVMPEKIGGGLIGWFAPGGVLIDMERGADGKFYLSQYRTNGNEVGLQVIDAEGNELFNSMNKTRELLDNPAAVDIFRNSLGIAVSPDQKWLAVVTYVSDIVVMPLIDGIPDMEARLVVDTNPAAVAGRDVAFDAAGNLHYVSSGQGIYRVLAPGGHSVATTTWNGTEYVFEVASGAAPGLAGDFNGDDVVDGADFLVWQRGGSPNPLSPADLTLWKTNFGQTAAAPAAATVPEPAALSLVGVGLAAFAATCRRRNDHAT